MIGLRRGGHLDDRAAAQFVDGGERADLLSSRQQRHLAGCPRCRALVEGHRRARALLLRYDSSAELPGVYAAPSARRTPAFAAAGLLVLAVIVAVGATLRWNSANPPAGDATASPSGLIAEQTPSATAPGADGTAEPTPSLPSSQPAPGAATAVPTPDPDAAPTPTPGRTPTPSPIRTPSPTPTAVATLHIGPRYAACTSSQVAIAIVPVAAGGASPAPSVIYWQAAMSRRWATFVLQNVSTATCSMYRMTSTQLVNGNSAVLAESGSVAGDRFLDVAPGAKLVGQVETSDLCGAPPIVAPVRVGFVMEGGRLVLVDSTPTDTEAVPPCVSHPNAPGGTIELQGWAPYGG